MWKLSIIFLLCSVALVAQLQKYGVGRAATAEDIRSLGASVGPDGEGLPPGSGTAAAGREVYRSKCAGCHGAKGEGASAAPLVGGNGTLNTAKPLKTVGSYWPYATTLWDYIDRAMPFNQPGRLTSPEVYSAVAYVLYLNGIASENLVLDAKSLPRIKMPNRDGFVSDPRPDVMKKAEPIR